MTFTCFGKFVWLIKGPFRSAFLALETTVEDCFHRISWWTGVLRRSLLALSPRGVSNRSCGLTIEDQASWPRGPSPIWRLLFSSCPIQVIGIFEHKILVFCFEYKAWVGSILLDHSSHCFNISGSVIIFPCSKSQTRPPISMVGPLSTFPLLTGFGYPGDLELLILTVPFPGRKVLLMAKLPRTARRSKTNRALASHS